MSSATLLRYFLLPLLLCVSCQETSNDSKGIDNHPKGTTFLKIQAQHSGIDFQNTLKEDLGNKQSVFHYDYFYSGAGVGIADLDNDGLQDIFFVGNQVNNALYRNKGNMQFENVSAGSGINKNKGWGNGVTFADINNDGLLDIYICQGGPPGLDRTNKLYVNKGNMKFAEQAAQYGLNDPVISTQAAFFDYDKDGDLDCLVMNENPLYGVQPQVFYNKYLKEVKNLEYASSSHLYERRGDRYYDVTKEKGLLKPTFGLGLGIADINDDGWLDIYISNDYYIPDALYINQKGKGFKDEVKKRMNQVSYYSMGMDIADINNDAHQDIFTLDMAAKDHYRSKTLMASMNVKAFDYFVNTLGFQHQYMFNALQLNNGNHTFKNIGHTGVAKTDWSWSVLMQDFDNDSDKDIYITNGIRKNGFDNDYRMKMKELASSYKQEIPLDSLKELYEKMPSSRLKNVVFENLGGNNRFMEKGKDFGLDELSYSNGAAYGDLDNDGDLDIVVNNIDEPALLYQNRTVDHKTGNFIRIKPKDGLSESYPKITLKYDGKTQMQEIRRVRGYYSSSEHIGHFGLGNQKDVDTVRVEWPSGKVEEKYKVKANQTLVFDEKNAKPPKKTNVKAKSKKLFAKHDKKILDHVHLESDFDDFLNETLLPYKQSTLGPFLSKGDFNGDGLDDILVGGAKDQPACLYLQVADGFKLSKQKAFERDKGHEDMESLVFDYDGDGDNDLLVISGSNEFKSNSRWYEDRLYLNDGNGTFNKTETAIFGAKRNSGKSVIAMDYDADGDSDIIVGNRMLPGKYPIPEPSVVYENQNGKMVDVTAKIAPELMNFGAINAMIATDFDNDGLIDFIAVGEWTGIGFFKNNGGTFMNVSKEYGVDTIKGWWFSVTETDINNDGNSDYVIGNLGINTKYKTTNDKPLRIYADDFDDNGTHDMMLSYAYKGKYVPLRGRECSSGQMPVLAEKFKTYKSFANAGIVDLFGDEKINTSYQAHVNEFRSILLVNTGKGKFEKKPLPIQAQYFPVLASISHDVNTDGYPDMVLAGGIYNTEVETPRFDAGVGLVLLSDGNQYRAVPPSESGLHIPGNVKSIGIVDHKGLSKTLLFVGKNNEALETIEMN